MDMLAVRDMRAEDAQPMEELLVAAWQTAYDGVVDPAFVATRRTYDYAGKFRSMLESGEYRIRVAELGGRMVGLATGGPLQTASYDCETKGLYVHPQYQGRGIGTALLRDMMEHFRKKGCRSMIVWTFLGVNNNGFYQARGGTLREQEDRKYGEKSYRMAGFAFHLPAAGAAELAT
jgi:GNAT superfamily N-acetyltransferase